MHHQQYANEEAARTERPRSLFGPLHPSEMERPRWDWRREVARALLLGVEGLWLLTWSLFFIHLGGIEPAGGSGRLVGGWFLLAGLALLAGHLVVRLEERLSWGRARLLLAILIVLSTGAWWHSVSGGLGNFLYEIGNVLQLRPGPGFWTLWLALLAWSRGLEWSQRLIGLSRARGTLHAGLLLLGILALVVWWSGRIASLQWIIAALWLGGMMAIGLIRLVVEDWALASRQRPLGFILRQAGLLLGAILIPLTVGSLLIGIFNAPQRQAISAWLLAQAEEPAGYLGLFLLHLAVLLLTLIWHVVYWIVIEASALLGIQMIPPQSYQPPAADPSINYLLELLALLPPWLWFAIRLSLFLLFLLLVLAWLITKMERARYLINQAQVEQEEEPEPRLLHLLLERLPDWPWRWPRLTPEPADLARRLYVRLVRLGARRGARWGRRHTPYEHERALQAVLPGCAEDIHLITEQYVRVRYAGETLAPQEIEALESAWERLAALGK